MSKISTTLLRGGAACIAVLLLVLLVDRALAQSPDAGTSLPEISALLPRDLSPWGMFIHADIVVKLVLIGLAFASLVTWTVCFAKAIELTSARRKVYGHLRALAKARSLADVDASENDPVSRLIVAAEGELDMSRDMRGEGIKERITLQLERIEVAASRHIARGMGVLATIGATAPFVGLFGTVWGIMNAFIGISKAHTDRKSVV